jgi:hypothetical protein
MIIVGVIAVIVMNVLLAGLGVSHLKVILEVAEEHAIVHLDLLELQVYKVLLVSKVLRVFKVILDLSVHQELMVLQVQTEQME